MPKKSKKKHEHKHPGKKDDGGLAKNVRGAVEPVLKLAENPVVGELVAGALLAGVEAFLGGEGGKKAKDGASKAVDAVKEGGETAAAGAADAAKEGPKAASLIGYAVAVAAGEIATRIVKSYEKELGQTGDSLIAKTAARKAADVVDSIRGKRKKKAAPPADPDSDAESGTD